MLVMARHANGRRELGGATQLPFYDPRVPVAGVVHVVVAGDRRRRRGRAPGTREARYVPQLVAIREMGQMVEERMPSSSWEQTDWRNPVFIESKAT
jgi:hypothetical protein